MGDQWTGVTALADPSRRALYDYVRRADHPVSREEAADAAHISRNLAAFHLDKLVDVGLLQASYQAPPDRPRGRGRSPKVYEATGGGVAVTMPQRRYQLIAEILADAIADDPGHADQAVRHHARQRGHVLGTELRGAASDILAVLDQLGFEPHPNMDRVQLHNCPFHALAARQTTLVCGLNHAFLTGLLNGLNATAVQPRLAPHPGRCCVELTAPGGAT
jgi:predicted ArsR family transcriptional regulator